MEIICEPEIASWYHRGFCRRACEDNHLVGRARFLPFPLEWTEQGKPRRLLAA